MAHSLTRPLNAHQMTSCCIESNWRELMILGRRGGRCSSPSSSCSSTSATSSAAPPPGHTRSAPIRAICVDLDTLCHMTESVCEWIRVYVSLEVEAVLAPHTHTLRSCAWFLSPLQLLPPNQLWVWSLLRLVFFPAFLLCHVSGTVLPVVFNSDWWPSVFMGYASMLVVCFLVLEVSLPRSPCRDMR
jgi:hypothetical protein